MDIAERKRLEEQSRFLDAAFRSIQESVAATDTEYTIKYWNEVSERIYGIKASEAIGKKLFDVIEIVDPSPGEVDRQFKQGEAQGYYRCEQQHRTKYAEVWVSVSVQAIEDKGKCNGWVALATDITERKRAEEALRESEELYVAMANNPHISFYIIQDGKYVFMNQRFQESMGYTEDTFSSIDTMSPVHPDDQEMVNEKTIKMLKGELRSPFEFRTIVKDGETRVLLQTVTSVQYKGKRALLGCYMDITERKRVEEALRESERKFRDLAELLPETAFETDAVGNLTFANQVAFNTFGFSPEHFNTGLPALQIIIPADRDRARDDMQRLFRGEKLGGSEYTAVKRDGSKIPVIMYASRIIRGNEPAGLRVIVVDISKRKQIEEELKQTMNELQRSNTELEQFAYIASHDLQEPLRMVASYTQLLARRYQGRLDADADEFITYAVDGANRMQKLITDLLEFSRVSTRGKPFELTECEAIVDQAVANLYVAIEESGAIITRDPLPKVKADATQLVRLFQNLIGNAIKFRSTPVPEIHIGVKQSDSEWLFAVRDNGIGIDPQYADRIFLIFQRLHGRADYPGTGIGLAICKKIAERHGGRIWVEPNTGQGSTFYFTMPTKGGK